MVRFLLLDEPTAPLSEQTTALEEELTEHGMDVAYNHYRQAVKNFVDQDFEAANGQLRTMFEAVITHIAKGLGFNPANAGTGGPAINYLISNNHLPDRDGGGFIQGLWRIVHIPAPRRPAKSTSGC